MNNKFVKGFFDIGSKNPFANLCKSEVKIALSLHLKMICNIMKLMFNTNFLMLNINRIVLNTNFIEL